MAFIIPNTNKKSASSYDKPNIPGESIQHVQEASDIAQTIRELNEDKIETHQFSSIDMKSRLAGIEISSILALDSLVNMELLPPEAAFIGKSKKRLAVSLDGQGRKEIVEISQGMKEQQSGSSILTRIGNVFRPSGGKP